MDLKNKITHKNIKVLIVAAGEGRRSGLNYPKTLFKVNKVPILVRIFKKILHIDLKPTIIVSKKGRAAIIKCLNKYNFKYELIIQNTPEGMGDAVLKYQMSKNYKYYKNILLLWGDLPFIYKQTINKLVNKHILSNSFITIVSGVTNNPYTLIFRKKNNNIYKILENRTKKNQYKRGERDIGVFMFNRNLLSLLSKYKKYDYVDGKKEHNFLYLINIIYKKKLKIINSSISNDKEFISFNSMKDLK